MSNDSKPAPTPGPSTKDALQAAPGTADSPAVLESSWGDRWKKATFNATTYFGINYVFNTLFSVAVAYFIERKCDAAFRSGGEFVGKQVARFTGGDAKKIGGGIYMGTKGFSLTTGGTLLVPVLKVAEDHRHSLEFKAGHALDVMQNTLGLGNAATRENLAEYNVIKQAVAKGKAPDVSPEDLKRFTSQHCAGTTADGKYGFIEQKVSWPKVIAARAAAWGVAFATNYSLERVFGLESHLNKVSPDITKRIAKFAPSIEKLAEPNKVSANLVNDSILCVSSAVTTPVVMKALKRRDHAVKEKYIEPGDDQPLPAPLSPDAAAGNKQWSNTAATAPAPTHIMREQKKAAANDDLFTQRA